MSVPMVTGGDGVRVDTGLPPIVPRVHRKSVSDSVTQVHQRSQTRKECTQQSPFNRKPFTPKIKPTPSASPKEPENEEKTFVIQTRTRTVSDVAMQAIQSETQVLPNEKIKIIENYLNDIRNELTLDEIKAFSKLLQADSIQEPLETTFPKEVFSIVEETLEFLKSQLATNMTAYRYFRGELTEYIDNQVAQ